MKKMVSLGLVLVLCFTFLPSCAKLDTTGLLEAAPALIKKSIELNEIYYGEGIPYNEGGVPIGNYYPADKDYLDEHGFHTIDELKALTSKVFSENYCRAIFTSVLSGFSAEGSGYIYARYSSSQAEAIRDENETILVSSTATSSLAHIISMEYDYAGIRLGKVDRKYAMVLIPTITVFAPDEEHSTEYTVTEETEIKFVYENGWRIDSATY